MQLRTIIKHALLVAVVTVATFFAVFLFIFPSLFIKADGFMYTRTPSGVLITSPVSLRFQGIFGTDFCANPTVIAYGLQISGYTAGNIDTARRFHTQGEVVDDTWTFDLPVGRYQTISMRCYASSTGNQILDQGLEFNGAGGTIFQVVGQPTINVVKTVINDNGGTKVVADFPLFVGGSSVVSGITNTFPAGASYLVTETGDSNYTQAFSGDCDVNGNINLALGDSKFCIITNNDIEPPAVAPASSGGGGSSYIAPPPVPPLIDVVKIPGPLALPNGPGPVLYTYILRNIGTVSVENVTMVGDTCSPIVLVSGDTFGDSRLDVNEEWTYTCISNLTETHTNTVVATGWASGMSAVDIASSTVIVGAPIVPGLPETGIVVPPLIHVTKVPSRLTLSAGGGMVTYTNIVTNPGEVALSNIRLTDDKCGPVEYISGDINNNSKLDTSEAWKYVCQMNLIKTAANTVVATGEANGLVARDFAIATVVVALAIPSAIVPTTETVTTSTPVPMVVADDVALLPDTGWASEENMRILLIILSIFFVILLLLYIILSEYFNEKRL